MMVLYLWLQMDMVKVVWVLGPPTLTTQKWIVGLVLFSSKSRDYSSMSHSNKEIYYYSLSWKINDQLSAYGDGIGGVGTMAIHFDK